MNTGLNTVESLQQYYPENWVWNGKNNPKEVLLSSSQNEVYFHHDQTEISTSAVGVRGSRGFLQGEHYWEVTLIDDVSGKSLMIGVSTSDAALSSKDHKTGNLLGMDNQSWGITHRGQALYNGTSHTYCDSFFEAGTIIGVHLNLYTGTLAFYCNGKCLGIAFKGLHLIGKELFPMVSSGVAPNEAVVGVRTCRLGSLQQKCCSVVVKRIRERNTIFSLPLPSSVHKHLFDLM